MPRSFFGLGYALFAYLRICIAAIYICLLQRDVDLIFCDQISAPLAIFHCLLPRASLCFYCHFPDQLLTTRETILKLLYRCVIDVVESRTTSIADTLLVNSKFTRFQISIKFKSRLL